MSSELVSIHIHFGVGFVILLTQNKREITLILECWLLCAYRISFAFFLSTAKMCRVLLDLFPFIAQPGSCQAGTLQISTHTHRVIQYTIPNTGVYCIPTIYLQPDSEMTDYESQNRLGVA